MDNHRIGARWYSRHGKLQFKSGLSYPAAGKCGDNILPWLSKWRFSEIYSAGR